MAKTRTVWLLPLLLLTTLVAYQPAWHGGKVWDDDGHITRADLPSVDGLRRIWLEIGATQQYYPVAHSVFWLEHAAWGEDTLGYHLVNIALHTLSAFVLALVLRRLDVDEGAAILAAMIFALHPVHVESVAWMTELKNTLSGALYLGAALAYLRFDNARDKRAYAAALVLFVLAVLSKSVTATLPAALLVVFWWKRGRLNLSRDVLPLVPLFALGMAAGLTTAWIERTLIGADGTDFQYTFVERCLITGRALWFYLASLFWPAHLIFIYPRWDISQQVSWQYLYPLAILALAAGLWMLRKRARAPLAAFLCFAGTLFPALGFFNIFPFQFSFVADHFQYLASIPIIAVFSVGLMEVGRRWRQVPVAAGAAIAVVLGILTWNQSRIYANAEALYLATIRDNPACWMAYNNLGRLKLETATTPAGIAEALSDFKSALAIRPGYAEAHNNIGVAYERMGRTEDSLAEFRETTRLEPRLADGHTNTANALALLGRLDEAVAEYKRAAGMTPRVASAHENLGVALQRIGRFDEAVVEIQEALRLDPSNADSYVNLGNAYGRVGRLDDAASQYRRALALNPNLWQAHANLGYICMKRGELDESVRHLQEAIRLQPESTALQSTLAEVTAARQNQGGPRPSNR